MPHSQKSYVRILTSRSLNKIAHLDFCKLQQNMQYSQTFQFLLFTRHHQEFCFSAFFLLFTCKLGLQKFIWVDVGMSFRIINFLKYPNNAIVFDSRLINAINFLPDWCVLQIFFHKYISFKFKALFLHINWQCSSLTRVTNSTSSLSWIQCKFNRANMYLSTFRKTVHMR